MASPAPVIPARDGIVDEVQAALGAAFLSAKDEVDEVSIDVARDSVAEVLTTLRDRFDYQQLMEIAGVDYPERAERFEVVYHLLSVTRNHRLRIRVSTDEEQPVPTATGIFPVAGWLEREVFDMYGVIFAGNPDLRRILTDYGFRGHPQRKDFPLTGYVELRYSEEEKRVVYEPVSLAQDFRTFDFLSPWEGAEYVIPGDEKAAPEAPGAPTPLKAAEIARPAVSKAKPAAKTPKTTEKPADTGAGEPANKEAAKTTAQKPRARKAPPPRPDAAAASEAPNTRKPRAPRTPKSDA